MATSTIPTHIAAPKRPKTPFFPLGFLPFLPEDDFLYVEEPLRTLRGL